MEITSFAIFKNDNKKNDREPDYHLTHFDKETKESTRVGVGWIRESTRGTKFISVSLEKPYQNRPGFKLHSFEDTTTSPDPETGKPIDLADSPF